MFFHQVKKNTSSRNPETDSADVTGSPVYYHLADYEDYSNTYNEYDFFSTSEEEDFNVDEDSSSTVIYETSFYDLGI